MASLRYHAGRMVLSGDELRGWHVRIKTDQGKLELPLTARRFTDALMEAERLYVDARVLGRGPRCQSCVHWRLVEAECSLEFPEGRASGGAHAKDCSAYWAKR